ncbi:MAG: transglutaminase domain-containing protein [Bacteroidales bacterium]|nr:transglutaminase domain-containing protein [Bacteroidales bacterium]
MIRLIIKTLFMLACFTVFNNCSLIAQDNTAFLDYQNILITHKDTIKADSVSIEWGKKVIQDLNLVNATDFEKASKIQDYLSKNLKYNFKSSITINEIIKNKGGNCVSHAIIGIFLLRLADVPAKFAHEVQIIKQYTIVSLVVGRWAKKHNDGINSYWHNDHIWVWFNNTGIWEAFDSALDLCGFNEFYHKRFYQHKKLSKGFAQRWAGPPFVIWEETNMGCDKMINVTRKIWNDQSLKMFNNKTEWLRFIDLFNNWSDNDFHKEFLPDSLLNEIKLTSRKWF